MKKKKKNGNSKFKKKIHPVSKDLRTSTHWTELHVCGSRHKRNIITSYYCQAYSCSSDVTGTHLCLTRDLNRDFIFAPLQCEDRSLSNHTLRGIRIICLIKLDEKLQEKKKRFFRIKYFGNTTYLM